jgi:hypothetical protein
MIAPNFVNACLWSYDTNVMDIEKDKQRIITNVLNYGGEKAVEWLFETYPRDTIQRAVRTPMIGEWNKKSAALWSLVFEVEINKAAVKYAAS